MNSCTKTIAVKGGTCSQPASMPASPTVYPHALKYGTTAGMSSGMLVAKKPVTHRKIVAICRPKNARNRKKKKGTAVRIQSASGTSNESAITGGADGARDSRQLEGFWDRADGISDTQLPAGQTTVAAGSVKPQAEHG